MKKKNKIMLIAVSIIVIVVILFLSLDGTLVRRKYDSVWSEQYIRGLDSDQSRMVAAALTAGSSHNLQPWLVKSLDEQTLALYADLSKALPVVDADNAQLLISQGTFIENFVQGAKTLGYAVDVEYSEPDMSTATPLTAKFHLEKKTAETSQLDTIASSTYVAKTGGTAVDWQTKTASCLADFKGFESSVIDAGQELSDFKSLLLQGTVIESQDEAATKELLRVFRWTEWDKNQYRNGLSLTAVPSAARPFIQPVMKLAASDWQRFGQSSISMFKQRLESEQGYILIKCENPSAIDYMNAGRLYQQLIRENSGYVLRPAMQVLEEFTAMQQLHDKFQSKYGSKAQVMMVIGVQPLPGGTAASNPRHLVSDILIS